MIRAGIIGGAGYTAGELIRLLINHPQTEIAWIHSTSNAGNPVTDVHGGLSERQTSSSATSIRSTRPMLYSFAPDTAKAPDSGRKTHSPKT